MICAFPSIRYTGIPFSPNCISKWVNYFRIILGYVSCETAWNHHPTRVWWFRTKLHHPWDFSVEMDPDNWESNPQGGSAFNQRRMGTTKHDWWKLSIQCHDGTPNNAESKGYHGTKEPRDDFFYHLLLLHVPKNYRVLIWGLCDFWGSGINQIPLLGCPAGTK